MGAGTVEGVVSDPSGAVVSGATVEIHNPISSYSQTATTDSTGAFRFTNIPANEYHLTVETPSFSPYAQDVSIRSSVPVKLQISLSLAQVETTLTVHGEDLLENVPYAHSDVDQATFSKMPTLSPGSGLSDSITLSAPGVVADSNGFFHPLGDHAQTSFSIDGQPISDQQSKAFSTQIPLNAIQSMELITGTPAAEFGDKTSLVVNATTRSGLGAPRSFGSFQADYGSFGTVSEEATLGFGSAKLGNFLAVNSLRSGRFLDTPEFRPIHAIGNNGTLFDHFDFQPNGRDIFHLDFMEARNWFQTPNNLDNPGQDQRSKIHTTNIAAGYQHVFSPRTLFAVNPFVRRDDVNYYPSRDPFSDQPATLSQHRKLTNYGLKADLSYVRGVHNPKVGTQLMQTRLDEDFSTGLTDPFFNAVCLDGDGNPLSLPNITDPGGCEAAGPGFVPNPDLLAGFVPFDLTRGGHLFGFRDRGNINQAAFYVQDSIAKGGLGVQAGLRVDRYNGLSKATGVQPRIGVSYLIKTTGTVLRAAYSRTFETPYNENLLLSSATGAGGLAENVFGALSVEPLKPGRRNQYNAGVQQAVSRFLQVDAEYFWKFTDNAYDFDLIFDTPVTFPISWRKSKLDGVAVRLSTPNLRGFQAYAVLGHTRARYFGPENGGLIFNSPLNTAVFRIDHDQAFQQTTYLRYQRPDNGPWLAFTWRYDSGLVAGEVPDVETALTLTGAQQAAIGFFCGGLQATPANPITECASGGGATRLRIPAEGTADDDHNPPRIAPRHLFDMAVGTDNLFHTERFRTKLQFTVINLTNQAALYNFLSTFSGTHFVAPRTYQASVGLVF